MAQFSLHFEHFYFLAFFKPYQASGSDSGSEHKKGVGGTTHKMGYG
jgi:hypothetical protein